MQEFTGMIADRRHPDNGRRLTARTKEIRFYVPVPIPAVVTAYASDVAPAPKQVILHYGTFNGVPVWTAEWSNT